MDHHFLPHHTSHTPQISHPSSQHGQLSQQHQQSLPRPPFAESNPSTQQQPQQGHGQGSQAQAQQGQGQQPPQIRSRITVVCAECKRLKLRCDRRAPCGSCTKRDTIQRCIYSPAAAEKVDLHSLNNRLIQVEAALAMITSGQFESVYPGVRELVENVRGLGGLATGTGPAGPSGHAHGGSMQGQGGREGYRERQTQGPQGQSASHESSSHPQTVSDSDNDPHRFSHQHTHQHHHHGTATSHAYSASTSFTALARDCARVIDPNSSGLQVIGEEPARRGTMHSDSSRAQTQLIKLEPSPSDLGFDGSRSPSPIPFFAPTSQPTCPPNTTIQPSVYTSNTTAPPILLPALSIYYPLPTIPPPGSTEHESSSAPFSGLSSADGLFSSMPTHTSSNSSHPQITAALLALLPTGEQCLRWLELAEKVINVRGLPLEFGLSSDPTCQSDSQPEQNKEKTAWESFEERCWPLIGAQGKPRVTEGEKKERTRHRERERRRERDRDKPPGSTSTSPTTPGGSKGQEQREKDSARERNLKEQEREKARRARQIYFGGLASAPGGPVIPPGMPRRRAIDEYREREGLSPSPGSSGVSNEPRVASPPPFRPPGRREHIASMPFHQAVLSAPKRDEPLTFFALMCTVLAIGGITERAQTAKLSKSDDPSVNPGSSTSSKSTFQAMDASPSPEFLYALGRQALGVWDTQISSSSSNSRSFEKEQQKLEYILTCCAAASYVLLGLELGARPDRDDMFGGGEESDGEGLGGVLPDEVEQQPVVGYGSEEEERHHEESNRRKAGRIIYGLVGKMVNAGRAMGLSNDPDLRSQGPAPVKQESDYASSTGTFKFGRDEWKRAVWWEIVFWDLFVADVFGHQAYISPGSYTTRLPGANMSPPQNGSETSQRFTRNDGDEGRYQAQKLGNWGLSAEYLISRYRLTSLTLGVQSRLARPDCCCGYTLDQASSIEGDVRAFLSQLPEPLKVSSHVRSFDDESPSSPKHQVGYSLRQTQAYELAIVANTLLLGTYAPFISSTSNTHSSSVSTRPPSAFGSTLLPSTGPGKSVMGVGSSLPPGLANNGNMHASSHGTLSVQPTPNAISAASAKSASTVKQNDSNLGGHAGSGASVNFTSTTILQSAATNSISGTHTDVNPSSGPGGATSGVSGSAVASRMKILTWGPADSVTLGSAGSGMSRRGREVETVDGNSGGVIDMPRLGDHHVNTLAIHASVRAAKSIVRLFDHLRDTILDIKSTSDAALVVPALFIFYPPPTTLLHTLLVLARAQGDFCSTSYASQDSWSGIADPQELLNDIDTALSIIDRGNYWVDQLCKDDRRLLDWIKKKAADIRNCTSLDTSTRLTMDIMARFDADEDHDTEEDLAATGIQHLPHGMKRKHSQVSVSPGAVNGSGARAFDHEFNLDDTNIDSLPNISGSNGSAGGCVGEVMMDVLSGSGSNPAFDFSAMERSQGAQTSMLEHQIQSAPAPQSEFIQSDQLRHQGHSLPAFEHKLTNDHPIAQQQHHSFTEEMGAPYHHHSQVRQKSPTPQSYNYLDSHASRPQETLADRLTKQRRDKIQEQLQRERDRRASGGSEKEKERKSSSGSSSSRKSILPAVGIRLRPGRDGQVITGSTHSSASSGKSNEDNTTALIAPFTHRRAQESGGYGQLQQLDGSITGPSSPNIGFRSRSASLNQSNQAHLQQMHYDQQQSALQQQHDLVPQQHMDFSSLTMSHGLPMSSPTEDFALDHTQKKSYDGMHVSERSTPSQSQQPPFGPQPPPFSPQTYDQGTSQSIHGVFDSPQPTSQYERSVDNTNSTMMNYHSTSSPFANANGATSGSGSPFPMNSSGHPTPTFPSHHPTPPIFGAAPPPSTNHPSPVNFFHNQFSGHESVSYANSPVSSTNLPHQHPQPTIHHQPQPLQSQRNALMDMQLDRMEHSMMSSIPGTPVYEKSQLQPLDSFDSKTGVVMSDMHGMGQHNMSEQLDMSGGSVWGNRGTGTSTMSVEHHHQQLHQRHQQDMVSQNAFWNNNSDLKFYQ